jgi:hypothetical protein
MSAAQINAFDTNQVAGLSLGQIQALTTTNISGLRIEGLSSAAIQSIETEDLALLTNQQWIDGVTLNNVMGLSTRQVSSLGSGRLNLLETRDVTAMLSQQINAISSAQISGLSASFLQALSTDNVKGLSTLSISLLSANQIAAIEIQDFASLTSMQMSGFTTAQLLALGSQQYSSIGVDNVKGLTTKQLASIGNPGVFLSTAAISGLLASQVGSLSTSQVASLVSSSKLGAFNAANIVDLNLRGLSPTDIKFIDVNAVAAIGSIQIAALSSSQFFGLSAPQIQQLTTSQLRAFHTGQPASLTTAAIASVLISKGWLDPSDAANNILSAAQTSALYYSPLVFDIDGNGIRTLSVDQGVRFDLDADGKKDQTGWVGSGDGLLARDLDGDGQIDDGSELFGEATVLADGSRAKDGFEALASLDANRDGVVDAKDAGFASLKIWSDADADGYTDAGELKSLSELGITSVRVDAKSTSVFDNGNFLGLSASYERADGTQGEVADVWFRVSSAEELEQKAAALGEALTSYGASASGTGGAGAGASAKSATAQASLAPSTTPAASAPTTPSSLTPMVPSNIAELAELLKAYKLPESLSAAPTLPGLLSTQATQGLTGQSGFAKKDSGILGGSSQGS